MALEADSSAKVGDVTAVRRRRRSPEDARAEIMRAAVEVMTQRPAQELTVAAIMQRTTLSRKSFYVYFRDRSELIGALVSPLRTEADAALQLWRDAEDPVAAGRTALLRAAQLYRRESSILRAVFWSSGDDPEIVKARRQLAEPVIAVAEATIRGAWQSRSGSAPVRRTAEALVTMNIHSLLALEPETTDHELDVVVKTLSVIWERTLFPWNPAD